jgi:large subunit ribosomal protein L25
MKEFELNGSLRTETGKKVAKQLRKDENIPAVLYGGEKNVLFSVSERDIKGLIYTPDVHLVNLNINKKVYKAIIQELQFHPVSDKVIHIDFFQVYEDKRMTIALPVKLEGSAEGVKEGGKLTLTTKKLRVNGLVKDLPETLRVNVTDMGLGKSRIVGDLNFDKFEIVDPKTTVIATVKLTRAARGAQAAASTDAPVAEA